MRVSDAGLIQIDGLVYADVTHHPGAERGFLLLPRHSSFIRGRVDPFEGAHQPGVPVERAIPASQSGFPLRAVMHYKASEHVHAQVVIPLRGIYGLHGGECEPRSPSHSGNTVEVTRGVALPPRSVSVVAAFHLDLPQFQSAGDPGEIDRLDRGTSPATARQRCRENRDADQREKAVGLPSPRRYLCRAPYETGPDLRTVPHTPHRIAVETHQVGSTRVRQRFAATDPAPGHAIGIDGATLEANFALRGILRRDAGDGYGR